nr:expressed protein [Hymenolepis microstoma]
MRETSLILKEYYKKYLNSFSSTEEETLINPNAFGLLGPEINVLSRSQESDYWSNSEEEFRQLSIPECERYRNWKLVAEKGNYGAPLSTYVDTNGEPIRRTESNVFFYDFLYCLENCDSGACEEEVESSCHTPSLENLSTTESLPSDSASNWTTSEFDSDTSSIVGDSSSMLETEEEKEDDNEEASEPIGFEPSQCYINHANDDWYERDFNTFTPEERNNDGVMRKFLSYMNYKKKLKMRDIKRLREC